MKLTNYLILLTLLIFVNATFASNEADKLTMSYQSISDVNNYIKNEQDSALTEGKLLLWVVGGNWCHDSRSLATKLKHPELAPVISKHYRLSMIDVGYLNQGFEFTNIANMSTFYATPTVLIIDPETMSQTNAEDMFIWSNAYQVKQEVAQEYFERYSLIKSSKNTSLLSEEQLRLKGILNSYITAQEKRILAGYKVLGPMLKAYKEGETNPDFDPYWNALFEVRYSLQKHIKENKQLIAEWEQSKAVELVFPDAKPLPWETQE